MSESLLQVREVSKHFGGIVANENISFDVHSGEIVSIIGPNGAGKSTLFKMICGVRPEGSRRQPDSGRIFLRGKDITALPAHRICKLGLALVFQETEPLKGLTAIDNVAIGALVRDHSYHDAVSRAELLLQQMGLAHRRDVPLTDLTLAERKRLEIGRALATRPEVLMLDETMAGLTPAEVKESVELVREINRKGITVVLIEHVLEAVMSVSGKVIVLDQGRLISEGSPDAVVNDPVVIKAYLGGEAYDA